MNYRNSYDYDLEKSYNIQNMIDSVLNRINHAENWKTNTRSEKIQRTKALKKLNSELSQYLAIQAKCPPLPISKACDSVLNVIKKDIENYKNKLNEFTSLAKNDAYNAIVGQWGSVAKYSTWIKICNSIIFDYNEYNHQSLLNLENAVLQNKEWLKESLLIFDIGTSNVSMLMEVKSKEAKSLFLRRNIKRYLSLINEYWDGAVSHEN